MSFKDLELENIPFNNSFTRGNESGRRQIASAVDRLETSWNVLSKMTTSIMAVSVASVNLENRKHAIATMVGLLKLFLIANENLYSNEYDSAKLSEKEFEKEADSTDMFGKIMCERIDEFSETVISYLLSSLPEKWKKYSIMIQDVVFVFFRELEKEDAKYISNELFQEQIRMNKILFELVSYKLDDDSKSMDLALDWVKSARDKFTNEINYGLNQPRALSRIISSIGFPDVCQSIKNS